MAAGFRWQALIQWTVVLAAAIVPLWVVVDAWRGGKALATDFTARGWLPSNATSLRGNNATTWSDVNDDNKVQKSELLPLF